MTLFARSSLVLALAALAGIVLFEDVRRPTAALEAAGTGFFQDTDSDMLPDTLEWVLMSDPTKPDTDGDGVDDFIEASQHTLPGTPVLPLDNEMRAVVSVLQTPDGNSHVMFNLLVRVVSGAESEIKKIEPFIDINGQRASLALFVAQGVVHVAAKADQKDGLRVLVIARLASDEDMQYAMPCSIGVDGLIGQRSFFNGDLIADIDYTTVAVTPVAPDRYVFHPVESMVSPSGAQSSQEPQQPAAAFWSSSFVCELQMVPRGVGGGNTVCQVVDADCTGSPTLLCAPSCSSMNGKLFVLPDGLSFLNGR